MPVSKKGTADAPKKKAKGSKRLKRKDSAHLEDVAVSTSLPPKVDGQLRCHLRVSISQILWNVSNAPDFTQVRLLWWGEDGKGALFRPVDVKGGEKRGPMHYTTARYPVRSGPKQLASYFNDMSSLGLDVLSGPKLVVVGKTQVDHITSLTPNNPINGFYPVFSADQEKVAELQVSIVLESLMASYDSMSSVPTPDMSLQMRESFSEALPINPPRHVPVPAPQPVYSATDDPFRSPTANKFQSRLDSTTPRGVDSLIYGSKGQAVRDSGQSYPSSAPSYARSLEEVQRSGSSVAQPKPIPGVVGVPPGQVSSGPSATDKAPGQQPYATLADITNKGLGKGLLSTGSSGGRDLVSELLERGQKLREAMIVSTLNEGLDQHHVPSGGHYVPSGGHYDVGTVNPVTGSSGKFFKDFLKEVGSPEKPSRPDTTSVDPSAKFAIGRGFGSVGVGVRGGGFDGLSTSETWSDMEDKAIDLVLGSDGDLIQTKLMKEYGGSPTPSMSGDDDITSDPGDPIHDDALLRELFYKNPDTEESDISLSEGESELKTLKDHDRCDSATESLHEPGNMRPLSRSGSRRSSTSSIILDLEPTRDVDPPSPKHTPKKKRKKKKTTRATEQSDSDLMNTSRTSETSRVSFDPVPSDADEDSHLDSSRSRKTGVDGLSVERLTLLGRVHVARVVIDSLSLLQSLQPLSTKSTTRSRSGKPPRPAKKASTYFVEYQFPVVATSRDKYSPNAMATEVMRVASKKATDGMITFGHRSVFPVLFDGDAIDKWWKSALVFKLYSRAPAQKVPTMLGMCAVPLKSVLKSESLYMERALEVKDRSGSSSGSSSSFNRSRPSSSTTIGMLKLVVELASDSKDFAKALAKTRLAEMTNPRMVALPQAPPSRPVPSTQRERKHSGGVQSTAGTQTEPRPVNLDTVPLAPPSSPKQAPPTASVAPPSTVHQYTATPLDANTNAMCTEEALMMHTLLLIPEGDNITVQGVRLPRHGDKEPSQPPQPLTGWTGRDTTTRNLYLSCRFFWCDDAARSAVCWGTVDPPFKFAQCIPVLMTASLLERLRNNFVVVEVWDKKTTAENDQLVGIVKLPLHQFYMSYRDRRIAASLYKSQYPVVSIDTNMPIVNPFTGATHGQLKVLLAMGSAPQVAALQNLKKDDGSAVMVPERPLHYLERQHLGGEAVQGPEYNSENIVDHTFEVSIEAVRGLQLLESMIWGEADCFIQYHFPTQTQTRPQGGPAVVHAGLSLKTFRTATTLCIPDPVFNDVLQHKITMPEGTPVQREILTACAGAGGGTGGVPLEVWCRYYYPNTRDQVIAKAVLPLAKLCAMVTMKRHGEPNVQTFSLPLTPVGADPGDGADDVQRVDAGLLDITVNYRTNTRQAESQQRGEAAITRSLPGAQVCLAVSVLRASALKAAVSRAAVHDAGMQYAAEVGANAYVRVKMSFLQKQDERLTRTVARSFAPDFSCHMDFPVPLLWTELDCDALSLAEILDSAEVTFEIWHETPSAKYDVDAACDAPPTGEVTGRRLVSRSGDILLGTTTVPLVGLLKQATGIQGWFPVNAPCVTWDTTEAADQTHSGAEGERGLQRVVGGLETAIKFAHQEDRERVLHAGRSVGWAPPFEVEARDWEDADELTGRFTEIVVAADFMCCPLASALLAGQTRLDQQAGVYLRYKFYDRNAVCSKVAPASVNDDDYVTSEIRHSKTLVIPSSGPFHWYLNEERLELQVWLTHAQTDPSSSRPRSRDKLIGSAYVGLDSLADNRRRQHRVSGVFPLFKPGSANLGGACLRAHVTLRPHTSGPLSESEESDGQCYEPKLSSPKGKSPTKVSSKPSPPPVDVENTFSAYVSVERALHLPYMTHKDSGSRRPPSCYVSYQSAEQESPLCTEVIVDDDSPTWGYNLQTRLHKELLTDDLKNLVFKVWHKPEGARPEPDKTTDRVVGFVSVDLCPLMTGFNQITGWYNIMDFNGICQGQIKIAVTPHESVPELSKAAHGIDSQCSMMSHSLSVPRLPSQLVIGSQALDSESQGVLARFSQHYENVKHFHETLAARLGGHRDMQPLETVPEVSRSALFNSLRSNMADLDNLTDRLKTRLQGKPYPTAVPSVSPRDPLNHTGHSTQTETETSALTNSQQFLPVPPEGPATSTDGELRTLEGTKASAMSTACASELAGLHTGSSTLLSGLVKDTVGNILHEDMYHGGEADPSDPILAGAPLMDKETPFGSYRPMVHEDSDKDGDEEGRWNDMLGGTERTGEAGSFEYDPGDDEHDDQGDGEVIVPRALNDISNVNFNNMASHVSIQDYNSKLSEEDSWFTSHSPRRGSHLQYHQDALEETVDPSEQYRPDDDLYPQEEGAMLQSGPLAVTRSSLGGTVTTLGSVAEGDPYGRTLIGGQFNHTMKLHLNYDDSWATNNGSVLREEDNEQQSEEEEEEEVTREKLLEEPIGGHKPTTRHHKPDTSEVEDDEDDQLGDPSDDKLAVTQEERSILLEEDPTSSASVSRTTLSETGSQKVNKARKAAMFRREYDRHRAGHSSSDSEGGVGDSDGGSPSSRPGSRRRRPARTRASPTGKKTHFKTGASDSDNPEAYSKEPSASTSHQKDGYSDYNDNSNTGQSQGNASVPEAQTPRTEGQESDMDREGRQESYNMDGQDSHKSHMDGQDSHKSENGHDGYEYSTHEQVSEISDRTVSVDEGEKRGVSCGETSDGQSRHDLSKTSASSVPNFFLPSSDMEQSMRALRTTSLSKTTGHNSSGEHSATTRQLMTSLAATSRFSGTSSAKSRPLPNAQHSQRIAKIFSSKFAS